MSSYMLFRKNMTNNYQQTLAKLMIIFTTIASLFAGLSLPIKAQSSNQNFDSVIFKGDNNNPRKIGGEYIIFQLKNNQVRGLVYVQNSHHFSCFQGIYNQDHEFLYDITFAYPDFESNEWIKNQSEEKLSLRDFPYSLNPREVSEGANGLFNECFTVFN